MKRAGLLSSVALCLALCGRVEAVDRLVRVFVPWMPTDSPVLTGGSVPANKIHTLLFLKEPCPLPIEGASTMYRAWRVAGAYQLGCWYPTTQDEYTYINGAGELFHSEGDYWGAYPKGLLHTDGSVTITEPDFDSRYFFTVVHQIIEREHLNRVLQKDAP